MDLASTVNSLNLDKKHTNNELHNSLDHSETVCSETSSESSQAHCARASCETSFVSKVEEDRNELKKQIDNNRELQRQKERERIAKIEKELADLKKIEELKIRAEQKRKEIQFKEYTENLEKKKQKEKELEQKEKDYVYKKKMTSREDKNRLRLMQTKLQMERLKEEAKNQKRF